MQSERATYIKDCFHQYQKGFLYRRQSHVQTNDHRYNREFYYLIRLNCFADLSQSYIANYYFFFPSIFQVAPTKTQNKKSKSKDSSLVYNKFYVFYVQLYFLWLSYTEDLNALKSQNYLAQFFGQYQNLPQEFRDFKSKIFAHFEQILYLIKSQLNKINSGLLRSTAESNVFLSSQRSSFSLIYDQKIPVKDLIQKLKNECLASISKLDKEKKEIYIPQSMRQIQSIYLQNLVETFINLQSFSKNVKQASLNHFLKKQYYSYLKTRYAQYQPDEQKRVANTQFIMVPYTSRQNQILVTVKDMVTLRQKGISYEAQSIQMVKDILNVLIEHKKSTEQHYPLLQPHSIIFNQFSLKMQLNYQNPLLQSLGLLRKPVNFQNMMCHRATPLPYDPYSALCQFTDSQLFYDFQTRIPTILQQLKLLNNVKVPQKILKKYEQSQTWRFLMIACLIMQGKPHWQLEVQKNLDKPAFIDYLSKHQKKLKSNPENVFQYLGTALKKMIIQSQQQPMFYNSKLSFFSDLFEDGILGNEMVGEDQGNNKILRIFKLRFHLFQSILNMLNNPLLQKKPNAARYLMRFYLGLYAQITFIIDVCKFCAVDARKGLTLLQKNMGLYQNIIVNKFIHQTIQKFKQYEQKSGKSSQKDYLNKNCKIYYQRVPEFYHLITDKIQIFIKNSPLQKLAKKQKISNEELTQFESKSIFLGNMLEQKYKQIKICAQGGLNLCFLSGKSNEVQAQIDLIQHKIKLLMQMFIKLKQDNYIQFETLLLPLLLLEQQKKIESYKEKSQYFSQLKTYYVHGLVILSGLE